MVENQTDQVPAAPAAPAPAEPTPPVEPQPQESKESSAEDVVTRLSKQAPPKKEEPTGEILEEFKKTRDEFLATITDPQERQLFEEKWKNAERGINDKYQKLAAMRKEAESIMPQSWTPETVNKLLQDPNFVQAANAIIGQHPTPNVSEEDWSAFSPEEKAAIDAMRKDAVEANQKVDRLLAAQQQMMHQQEHETLKGRYAGYEATEVDAYMQRVVDGQVPTLDLKELVYRGNNYERDLHRAYQLGLQDRDGSLQEKLQGPTSTPGLNVTEADDKSKPTPKEGERSKAFFVRLAEHNRLHQRR